MIVFMRSLAASVSNENPSGAIWTLTRSPGTEEAPALPESLRSSSSTVTSSFGSKPKSFF